MISKKSLSFIGLKKLSAADRMKMVKSPEIGRSLMSSLTPTQIAELFPKYFLRQLPDVGILVSQTARERQVAQEQFQKTVQSAVVEKKEGGEGGVWTKIKKKFGFEPDTGKVHKPGEVPAQPAPTLSPEDLMTYNAIKSQPLGADDPKSKFLSTLTPEQLKAGGLEKVKDEQTGKEMYRYLPVESKVTEEDAIKSLEQNKATKSGLNANSNLIESKSEKTVSSLGINQRQFNSFREALAGIESSGGHYGIIGGAGNHYSGAYQFGGPAMKDAARSMGIEVPSRQEFLNNPELQEKFLDHYTALNHKTLMSISPKYRNMSPEERLGVLGYAHNQGAGGAAKWLRTGVIGHDANGTAGTKYTNAIASQLNKTAQADTIAVDPNTHTYTRETVLERQKLLQSQQESEETKRRIGALAGYTQSTMGTPGAPGTSGTAKLTDEQKAKWNFQHYNEISKQKDGLCARGTVHLAKQLFQGVGYFDKATIEFHGDASSQTHRNFFAQSGMYNAARPMTEDEMKLAAAGKLNLPGAIVTYGGGKWIKETKSYAGHSQMIMPDGTASSDFKQGRFLTLQDGHGDRPGRTNYNNPMITTLSDAGISHLVKVGRLPPSAASNINTQNIPTQLPSTPPKPEHPESFAPVDAVSDEEQKKGENYIRDNQPAAVSVTIKTPGAAPEFTQAPGVPPTAAPIPEQSPTAAPVKTEEKKKAEPPKPIAGVYRVDPKSFREASKPGAAREGYSGWMVDMASDEDIRTGFNNNKDAIEAGAYINKNWELHIKNVNHPKVKGVLEEYKGNVLTDITPKPKEEPKKVEPPKAEPKIEASVTTAPPAQPTTAEPPTIKQFVKGEGYAGLKDVPNPKYVPPQQQAPTAQAQPAPAAPAPAPKPAETPATSVSVKPTGTPEQNKPTTPPPASAPAPTATAEPKKEEPPKVPAKAEGGKVETGTGDISVYPIGGLRGDNAIAKDTNTAEPLFTMNTNRESVTPTGENGRANITPTAKDLNAAPVPQMNPMDALSAEIDNLRQQLATQGQPEGNQPAKPMQRTVTDRDPKMIDGLLDLTRQTFRNPTSERAFSRNNFQETGHAVTGGHYSLGNTTQA